jgi:hypothetical protein
MTVRAPTRLATWAWWLALVGAVVACGAAAVCLDREVHRYRAQDIADASLVQAAQRDRAALLQASPAPIPSDFTSGLPSSTYIVDDELQFASKLCSDLHVTLVSMTADPEVRRTNALGRIRIRIQIRGPYSALSAASAGLLDRFAGLVVLRTHIQPAKDAGSSGDAPIDDQQLELLQFTKPDELR